MTEGTTDRGLRWVLALQRIADRPMGAVIRDATIDLLPFASLVSLLAVLGAVLGMIPAVNEALDFRAPLFQTGLETQGAAGTALTPRPVVELAQQLMLNLDLIPYHIPYLIGALLLPAAFGFTTALRLADRYRSRERIALAMSSMAITLLLTWGPAALVPFLPDSTGIAATTLFLLLFSWGLAGAFGVSWCLVALHRRLGGSALGISMPISTPEVIAGSYRVLLPATLTFVIAVIVVGVVGRGLAQPLLNAAAWFSWGMESPVMIVLAVLLLQAMVFLGIQNYSAVVGWFWLGYLVVGAQGMLPFVAEGSVMPPSITLSAVLFGVLIGGVGATLGLNLLLLRAQSESLRKLGGWALVPSLFNSNETLIYGLPIPYSQPMAIPFFVAPVVLALTTWAAFTYGLCDPPQLIFPPFVPAPLGLWLTTGDWRSLGLVALNVTLSMAIYAPFLTKYDQTVVNLESGQTATT